MWPLWFAVVFGAIVASYAATDAPAREAFELHAASAVAAGNFLSYRSAAVRYLVANPGATGTVPDAALAPYWQQGYIRNPSWSNDVAAGQLFVYSASAGALNVLGALHAAAPDAVLLGVKNAAGHLVSYNGLDTGVVIPASIPVNAIVMAGS